VIIVFGMPPPLPHQKKLAGVGFDQFVPTIASGGFLSIQVLLVEVAAELKGSTLVSFVRVVALETSSCKLSQLVMLE
jgi:hypothetical protein